MRARYLARRLRLPSAPPKKADRRSFAGDATWQLEALAPDQIAAILRDAIEARLDHAAYKAALRREQREQERALKLLEKGRPRR